MLRAEDLNITSPWFALIRHRAVAAAAAVGVVVSGMGLL